MPKMDPESQIEELIRLALYEDVGLGDVTGESTIAKGTESKAYFLAKADGIISGLKVAEMVFREVDPKITVEWTVKDGDRVKFGTRFGEVKGNARSLLIAERLALNLMQRMSGIATLTGEFVAAVQAVNDHTKILDTRKTVPGLRAVDKQAVVHGGGVNHRVGLYDMVMIKDNHITASGGIKGAVAAALFFIANHQEFTGVKIEVETRTLEEVREALDQPGVDRIMLDNMVKLEESKDGASSEKVVNTEMLSQALDIINAWKKETGKAIETEASGNVTLKTVGVIAKTGVDFISSGALTHSVMALDISMKISLNL